METTQTQAGALENSKAPGELDRLSSTISYAHELIGRLESKLSPVSVAVANDVNKELLGAKTMAERHISDLINDLNAATSKLESLLHSIVL